jgi:antitoxin (DNA-binding transcriptional repressor) of toxin-antitoxin stability system
MSDSYFCTMKVSVADANNKLPELFKAAENGALVTICRRGVPVVDIVRIVRIKKPYAQEAHSGDTAREDSVLDQNWWKPMTNGEVEAFVAGRN